MHKLLSCQFDFLLRVRYTSGASKILCLVYPNFFFSQNHRKNIAYSNEYSLVWLGHVPDGNFLMVNLGMLSPEQIRSVVGNLKNLTKNLVFIKAKLDNGRLHRKGSFNLK